MPVEQNEEIKGIDVKVSLQCEGKSKQVAFKQQICGYQKFSAYPDMKIPAFFVDYNPALNISEDGENITILAKVLSPNGDCDKDRTITIPVSCAKAGRR